MNRFVTLPVVPVIRSVSCNDRGGITGIRCLLLVVDDDEPFTAGMLDAPDVASRSFALGPVMDQYCLVARGIASTDSDEPASSILPGAVVVAVATDDLFAREEARSAVLATVADTSISLNLLVLDFFAILVDAFRAPSPRFPVGSTVITISLDASESKILSSCLTVVVFFFFFWAVPRSLGGDKAANTVLLDALVAEAEDAFESGWMVILDEKKVLRRTGSDGRDLIIVSLLNPRGIERE